MDVIALILQAQQFQTGAGFPQAQCSIFAAGDQSAGIWHPCDGGHCPGMSSKRSLQLVRSGVPDTDLVVNLVKRGKGAAPMPSPAAAGQPGTVRRVGDALNGTLRESRQ